MLQTLLLTVLWIVTKAIHLSNFISQYIYIFYHSVGNLTDSTNIAALNGCPLNWLSKMRSTWVRMFTIDVMLPFFELVLNIPMFIAISTPQSIFFIHSFIILPTLINNAFRTIQHRAPVNKLHVSRWQKPSLVHSKSLEKNIVNVVSLLLPIEWTAQFFRMRCTVIIEIDCHKETTPFLLAVTGL